MQLNKRYEYSNSEYFEHTNKKETAIEAPNNIKACVLKRNELRDIPTVVPEDIEYLDLSDNKLREDINVLKYNKMVFLDLGYNLLVHHDFITNEGIEDLYLMANDIKEISESISCHKSLKIFDIAGNRITSLKNLSGISDKIEELYLGSNRLREFDVDLSQLKHLKILDLQFNRLEELDCSLLPESLEILLVNNNKNLLNIENIEKLTNLDEFYTDFTKFHQHNKK